MGINKIPNELNVGVGEKSYEMTIRDMSTDEIIYQEVSNGGVLCTVEKITSIEKGEIDGVHQVVSWGNLMVQFYATDQLTKWFKAKLPEMIEAFQKAGQIVSNIDFKSLFGGDK